MAAFGILLIHRWGVLDRPPFWDAAWSTAVGAAELSRNGLDWLELLRQPGFSDGGPGTHGASLVTLGWGALLVLLGPEVGRVAVHVLTVVVGGALVAATYRLASRYLTTSLALATAGVLVLIPVIVQQISDPYLDLPLALLTVLAVTAFLDRRLAVLTALAFIAVWIKATGLILVPLVALLTFREGGRRRWLRLVTAAGVAVSPLLFRLFIPSRLNGERSAGLVDGALFLLRSAFVALGSTIDVLALLLLFVVGALRLRHAHRDLILATSLVTVGFLGIHVVTLALSQSITVLPRYYIAVIPLWLMVSVIQLASQETRQATGMLVVLAVFSVVNSTGRLYLNADHTHPVMAERSLAAQEYLDMEIAGSRALAAADVAARVVDSAFLFRLDYPELGFVDSVPHGIVRTDEIIKDLPDTFAWVVEPHNSSFNERLIEISEQYGYDVAVKPVYEGRWTAHISIARRP